MKDVLLQNLGTIEYGRAWEIQEEMMNQALATKADNFSHPEARKPIPHRLLICRHPHVYTLGKHGTIDHLLINQAEMNRLGITFFKTNRGGDITYHGPGQLVAYPILDLEQFKPDLGWYMHSLEEVIIRVLDEYGIKAGRLKGATGVWLEPGLKGRERKICAMGVKTSRWMTMHGLALNMNTDLDFFTHIIPCGISDKKVAGMDLELGHEVDEREIEHLFLQKFSEVFEVNVKG